MAMLTGLYFSVNTNLSSLFLALSTFFSYNAIRFLKYKTGVLKDEIYSWFYNHYKFLIVLNLIVLFKIIEFVFQLSLVEWEVLFPFAIFTVLYMLPVMKFKQGSYSLRKIPGLKIFCIAISWAGLVIFFPLVQNSVPIDVEVFLFFIQQFIFVLVLTLPFDIRDIDFDSKELKTIPMVVGLDKTKRIALFLLLAINVVFIGVFSFREVVVLFFISLLLAVLIWNSERNQSKYYASFWIEGVPILWFITLYLCNYIA
jgi:hypothetical protein